MAQLRAARRTLPRGSPQPHRAPQQVLGVLLPHHGHTGAISGPLTSARSCQEELGAFKALFLPSR